jgi:hypothetical protein
MASFKFSELRKTKKGAPVSPEVNAIGREAVLKIKDADALKLFDDAEKMRWHGELYYPAKEPMLEVKFRRGVFVYLKINVEQGKALFRLNVINENVDFREDGHNERT